MQIVYANDMSDGSPWIECDDTVGEDYACDPQVVFLCVCIYFPNIFAYRSRFARSVFVLQ